MLNHASTAIRLSENKPECIDTYAVGLYVKLRILSFLMKSKLLDEGELLETREKAHSFVESFEYGHSHMKRPDLLGLVLAALGFSYYQVEGDRKIALHYLSKGNVQLEIARSRNEESDPCKKMFLSGIASVALWDTGLCYESEAEQSNDSKEALSFFKKARMSYTKALAASKASPWLIYRALVTYGIAGTLVREHELSDELPNSERKLLISKALSRGEEASSCMRRWSLLETDMLGGVANALFYQRMAELSIGVEREECIERSLDLISKAEAASRRVEGSRFSDANFGDIYLRGAHHYYKLAMERSSGGRGLLETSLKNCEASQKHFGDERHLNRMVDSLILGTRICTALKELNTPDDIESANRYLAEGKEQCQKSMSICRRRGWDSRLRETLELATVLEA